jgi:HK97 family phage prohead protease
MAQRSRPDPKPGESQVRAADVRSVDAEKRTVEVIASTEAVDSHGTVLVQDWNLERFARNPVVLWAHNATLGMDELPIGRCTRCEVVNGQLEATIQFAGADVNPRAEQVFQAYRQGYLRAVSVGFYPHSYRWEMREDVEVLVLSQNELFELSCVPVGSNPDALARALAARSTPVGRAPAENNTPMTEEEKALLALARRTLELTGEKDAAAAEARLRGLLAVEKAHEKDAAAAETLRSELADVRRAALIEGAVRDGKLPPREDLEKGEEHAELRAYLGSLSPLAASKGERSPLEAYLRTLPRRTPVAPNQGETPRGQKPPAQRSAPPYARGTDAKYVERAQAEKSKRRASGVHGPHLTDAPETDDPTTDEVSE